jgi:hypothetical protein
MRRLCRLKPEPMTARSDKKPQGGQMKKKEADPDVVERSMKAKS